MVVCRIIPTRVGTRNVFVCVQYQTWGSSPRVWGQVHLSSPFFTVFGIIPTRVGTRCHFYPNHGQRKDHPHACGDKMFIKNMMETNQGSSPRVWGQVFDFVNFPHYRGIIPTRVGTRPHLPNHDYFKKDHPHACGDKGIKIVKL